MNYDQTPGVGLQAGKFTDGDAGAGIEGSKVTAQWLNNVTDEMITVLQAVGLTPDDSSSTQLLQAIRLLNHPVGSIHIRADATDPATIFGGTWQQFGAGRALVGQNAADPDFNSLLETGGAKTHTLTVDEMPAHTHDSYRETGFFASGPGSAEVPGQGTPTGSTGGGQPHNNLQPYVVVAMWRRTA